MIAEGVRVGRLVLAATAAGAAAGVRDVAHALRRAELRPDGLGDDAVLVVRELADPAPGRLPARPSPADVRAWADATRAALAAHRASAARPALGPVPPTAAAVLFRDRSELLASLATDWLSGRLAERWWWPLLLGARTADAVRSAWTAHPRQVPAALDLLAGRGGAVRFTLAWPDAALAGLTSSVAAAWAAPPDVVAALRRARSPARSVACQPPWRDLVPEAWAPDLTDPARACLLVALAAARSPATVAAASLWRALDTFAPPAPSAAGLHPEEPGPEERLPPRPDHPETAVPSLPASGLSGLPGGPGHPAPGALGLPAGAGLNDVGVGAIRARRDTTAARPAATTAGGVSGEAERPPVPRRGATEATASEPSDDAPPQRRPGSLTADSPSAAPPCPAADGGEPPVAGYPVAGYAVSDRTVGHEPVGPEPVEPESSASHRPLGEVVTTRLGGVFFLLNLALRHGWYGDFTQPAHRGITCDPWRLLSLLGTALLPQSGPEDQEDLEDPLWECLATLSAPDRDEERARWSRWVGDHADGLRADLADLLGRPGQDVVALVLRRHAVVRTTATTVEVHLRLDELQIEIRTGGLDRDPGWVPAAGRSVIFRFD